MESERNPTIREEAEATLRKVLVDIRKAGSLSPESAAPLLPMLYEIARQK